MPAAAFIAACGVKPGLTADILTDSLFIGQPVAVQDWSGFYVGGNIGGAWDHRDASIFDPTGAFLASGSTNASGITGGGQIGYNYHFARHWVVGFEADLAAADLRSTSVDVPAFGQRENKIDAFGTARGRLGLAWDNWLFYGTGGFAWAHERIVRTQQFGTINTATPGTVESSSTTGSGWAAGGGVEWALLNNWLLRVEYLHLEIGSQSFMFPLAGQRIDAMARVDIGRFGISYKF